MHSRVLLARSIQSASDASFLDATKCAHLGVLNWVRHKLFCLALCKFFMSRTRPSN
jgi:hypothetical protein